MSESLFDEFEPVPAKQWKQKIQYDLKGADYNETVVTHTREGIDIKPFYHREDLGDLQTLSLKANPWSVTEKIVITEDGSWAETAQKAIEGGAQTLHLVSEEENISANKQLNTILEQGQHVLLSASHISRQDLESWSGKDFAGKLTIITDIIQRLATTGNWIENLEKDFQRLANLIDTFSEMTNQNSIDLAISADLSVYQNAGADSAQQLAYAMSHMNEYLNFLNEKYGEKKPVLCFMFLNAAGSNYFMEIAKLKALRLLWETLSAEYQTGKPCRIISYPTLRNKTIYDYNVNLLRTTTESMSNILGGADFVGNLPYNTVFEEPTGFGDRIARNQLLILKHESYFDKVLNPADGAYYIEKLTAELAQKGLKLFKDIEAGGGFLQQLKEHKIQKKIRESHLQEQEQYDKGELTLVGSNLYLNKEERMKEAVKKPVTPQKRSRKTIIEPIIAKRLSEKSELQRLKEEE
ncbi:methylmalonyl-CoA mutase subunit beta [Robertkochia aurantiaca]|uniref:methylmalonyl-CoA mutase subunit beta n=1 Tax=Robertkochia aurantiaca TaxID=2873700 RepID=UPI001CCDB6BB|nr:methylmalonyl-CoA mutase subunit beta [Robertkochia sp. 3YJGBD-33]